jgi:hypothetical protein
MRDVIEDYHTERSPHGYLIRLMNLMVVEDLVKSNNHLVEGTLGYSYMGQKISRKYHLSLPESKIYRLPHRLFYKLFCQVSHQVLVIRAGGHQCGYD